MDLREKVKKVLEDINPRLNRIVGARMDLVNVDSEKAEVFIKITQLKSSC